MARLSFAILILITVGSLPATGQTFSGSPKQIDQILLKIGAFSQFIMDSDYDDIADAYTVDAKIFPNNRDIISGRENIQNYWVLPEGVHTSYHKIIPEEISVRGKEAYDYGYYEGRTKRKDGGEVSWKGKYVIIWKKIAGEWKIYLDIWNQIAM